MFEKLSMQTEGPRLSISISDRMEYATNAIHETTILEIKATIACP